jgi:NAD(P)H-hydrate epimerase
MDPDITCYRQLKALFDAEKKANRSVIVDGMGLRLVSKYKNLITNNMVLTPHDGEFKALSGVDTKAQSLYKRIYAALDFAKTYGCTLVLKGHDTIITDGKLLKVNRAKTPALATMGTGDVLAGIIASYAALNRNLFESAAAAVYVHAAIGDKLYAQRGIHITAQDVIAELPETMKQFDTIMQRPR